MTFIVGPKFTALRKSPPKEAPKLPPKEPGNPGCRAEATATSCPAAVALASAEDCMTPDMICPNSLFSARVLGSLGEAEKSTLALEAVWLEVSIDVMVMGVLFFGKQ